MAEKDERPCTSCEPTRGGKAATGAWPKTLYLLRHGETELNVERKIQGWCDSPLTERGRDQARRARTSLERAGVEIDYACGSSLGRARQTAEIVTDVSYVPMDELKEWSFGSYEGESRLSMPPAPWGDFFAPFGGEAEAEVQRRLVENLTRVLEDPARHVVLAIGHGGISMEFLHTWHPWAQLDYEGIPGNCGIMRFEVWPAELWFSSVAAEKGMAFDDDALDRLSAVLGAQPRLIFSLVKVLEPDPEEIARRS